MRFWNFLGKTCIDLLFPIQSKYPYRFLEIVSLFGWYYSTLYLSRLNYHNIKNNLVNLIIIRHRIYTYSTMNYCKTITLIFFLLWYRTSELDISPIHDRENGVRRGLWGHLYIHSRAVPDCRPERSDGDQFLYSSLWRNGGALHSFHCKYCKMMGGRQIYKNGIPVHVSTSN